MSSTTNHFVTVEMRGLKPALVARAQADRVSVSVLVRSAIARQLGLVEPESAPDTTPLLADGSPLTTIKLSIRLTRAEADRLTAGALAAGLSRGAYLAGLCDKIPVLMMGANRTDHLAVLVASNAELTTLSRSLRHLTLMLSQANLPAALQYRDMLDTLEADIRQHLRLASSVLAELRPRRAAPDAPIVRSRRVRSATRRHT